MLLVNNENYSCASNNREALTVTNKRARGTTKITMRKDAQVVLSDNFPQLVGRLLDSGRISQSELARRMGTTPQTISAWLAGRQPDIPNLRKVAAYTGWSLPALIAIAFGIPMGEMTTGEVEAAILADETLDEQARRHYLWQLVELRDAVRHRRERAAAGLPPEPNDEPG